MKDEGCKECVVICAECTYGNIGLNQGNCALYTKNEMNCITGRMEPVLAHCIDHNKDGKCKGFKRDEDKTCRRRFVAALTEELDRQSAKPGGGYPDHYLDLLRHLEGYFKGYDSTIKPLCWNPSKKDKCGRL